MTVSPSIPSAEAHLEFRLSNRFRFVVIGSPDGSYFDAAAEVLNRAVETEMCRVPPYIGMGAAKASANNTPNIRAS